MHLRGGIVKCCHGALKGLGFHPGGYFLTLLGNMGEGKRFTTGMTQHPTLKPYTDGLDLFLICVFTSHTGWDSNPQEVTLFVEVHLILNLQCYFSYLWKCVSFLCYTING